MASIDIRDTRRGWRATSTTASLRAGANWSFRCRRGVCNQLRSPVPHDTPQRWTRAQNSDGTVAIEFRRLLTGSFGTSRERMWARVEISLGANLSCIRKRFWNFIKPASTQPLLSKTKMHGLQAGGDCAHYTNAEFDDVCRGKVRIADATAGFGERVYTGIQLLLNVSGGEIRQRFDGLASPVVEKKREFMQPFGRHQECAVIHQRDDVFVFVGPFFGRALFEAARLAGMCLADLQQTLQQRGFRIKIATKTDDGRRTFARLVERDAHHHINRNVGSQIKNANTSAKRLVMISDIRGQPADFRKVNFRRR